MQRWALCLMAVAGLFGAAGVGAAALAAHRPAGPDLQIAADFLLFHAAAVAAIVGSALQPRPPFLVSASTIALGTMLFCGDLIRRALVNAALFRLAAPMGGTLLMLGWLILVIASLVGFFRRRQS